MKELESLIALSHKYGANPRCVIAGGGNTSFKNEERLWVKASGHTLATITEEGFAVMDRARLAPMGEKTYSTDASVREQQVKDDLAAACLTPDRRPSVETSLHNCMSARFVVHLHPTLVNGLMCSCDARAACQRLFPDALYIEYTDPGYTLFKKVYDRMTAYKAAHEREPQVIFLQNHGVFVGSDTPEEVERIYEEIFERIQMEVSDRKLTDYQMDKRTNDSPASGLQSEHSSDSMELVPAIRQIASRRGRGLKTVRVTNSDLALHFASSPAAFAQVAVPFTPDIIVYCKSEYVYLNADDADTLLRQAEERIEAYVARRGHTPKVLLVKGIGLIAIGDHAKEADTITTVFADAMLIARHAEAFGGTHGMEPAWVSFIDNWEVENYRRKVSSGTSAGRMAGRTAVVTGAAQGFGEGIARLLMAEGANIVVADINKAVGQQTVASFNLEAKNNRAIFVKTNVSDIESIQALVRETLMTFGAVDVFVSNAGVLRAGSLDDLTVEQFEFVTHINYMAYFYCAKVVSKVMKTLTQYDPDYFADIIQVNSKSGLRGSKANYAYAGSKFGGIGLTQSFARELAPFRIKVNSICPGNFYDGPLWSDPENGLFVQYLRAGKVPGAKTVEDVKTYYLAQVPMRKSCSPADVTKAILYAIEQTGETGQAIPVTGGQVMLS
ncbi:MAG: SDR family NAD(P)-dependent oxidoreductase [Bacteroidaceae bacterium]|nr:SDR family NAD(P)-dependent oxidoreductase [Bacteroidaceae bacterium]